jgi:hypothetical protein
MTVVLHFITLHCTKSEICVRAQAQHEMASRRMATVLHDILCLRAFSSAVLRLSYVDNKVKQQNNTKSNTKWRHVATVHMATVLHDVLCLRAFSSAVLRLFSFNFSIFDTFSRMMARSLLISL